MRNLGYAAIFICIAGLASAQSLAIKKVPVKLSTTTDGAQLYREHCAVCHGVDGKGAGPAAEALKTRPTDLSSLARSHGGTFPRDRVRAVLTGAARPVAAHGSTDMPVWGIIFRALDSSDTRVRLRIESIVAHLESLQEASSAPGGSGARLFRTYCASCHGSTARGDGPLATQLRQNPPDLTKYAERNAGAFPSERVARIIDGRDVRSHGDREMPAQPTIQ